MISMYNNIPAEAFKSNPMKALFQQKLKFFHWLVSIFLSEVRLIGSLVTGSLFTGSVVISSLVSGSAVLGSVVIG